MVKRRKRRIYTKEECVAEAKKYRTRSEWAASSPSYAQVRNNGWLGDCTRHMSTGRLKTIMDIEMEAAQKARIREANDASRWTRVANFLNIERTYGKNQDQ